MRAARLLLRLYPASFRNEYGADMHAIFAARLSAASSSIGRAAVWAAIVGDTIRSACLAHADLLRQDLRYTARTLRRAPGFAATAVAIMAAGIGATTAAFSLTDFVLIRPLPFPEPSRLVKLWERTPGYSRMELSPANYRDWTGASTAFERIGAYYEFEANLVGSSDPLNLEGAAVSADLLPTLGVQPAIGRIFAPADDRKEAAGTVILSDRLWRTSFGADPSVVGRDVRLDDETFTVVGVMPRTFRFPTPDTQFWKPLRFGEEAYVDRNDNWLEALGRLRPGVSIAEAGAELNVIAARSSAQYPKENGKVSARLVRLRDEVSEKSRLLLLALSGAAACVLIIACANLANLLLARAVERRRELAVRTALGAGRERMVRQLITESIVLSGAGGALGVLLAVVAVPLLAQLVPPTLPLPSAPAVDLRVLLFAVGLSAATGLAFGLAPAARGSTADLEGLRDGVRAGGGRREHLRSMLVVGEIVASVVLLVCAGLLLRALWRVQATDPGFRAEGVLTLQTPLPIKTFGKVSSRVSFYQRVLDDVRAIPGVESAAYVSFQPMGKMRGGIWPVSIGGRVVERSDRQVAFLRFVTPGYFATLGIPLVSGRDVSDDDTADRQFAAVVSESFVRRYWPNEGAASVLGRHFEFAFSDRTIVGVVRDVRMRGLETPSEPQVYIPYRQVDDDAIIGYIPKGLVVRTSGAPQALVPSIRAIVHRIDPTLPLSEVGALSDLVDRDTASRSVQVRVLASFAAVAFLLAAVGIHGLLSFTISQRTQEIGVRVALGATRADILGMVLKRSAVLTIAGILPGMLLAYAAARWMEGLLVGIAPADMPTFAAAVTLAAVMTMAGSLAPTLKALRVDPVAAIRLSLP